MGLSDAHGPQSACNGETVGSVPIADQVMGSLIPREGFGDLTCKPFRSWVGGDVDPDKLSTPQPNDDENMEQIEADGWNDKQVHGGNIRRMVVQGVPALT